MQAQFKYYPRYYNLVQTKFDKYLHEMAEEFLRWTTNDLMTPKILARRAEHDCDESDWDEWYDEEQCAKLESMVEDKNDEAWRLHCKQRADGQQ